MINADNNKDNDVCANCGKGEENGKSLKACTACKMVKYCNRECQIAHRPQHKKDCKKRAKELHEEALFKQPPPEEDCPICKLRLPSLVSGYRYQSCCGKVICSGCIYALERDGDAHPPCPNCSSALHSSDEEEIERLNKRVEAGDTVAFFVLGNYYNKGMFGLSQDNAKALELWHRAAELGHSGAYFNLSHIYRNGEGVEVDEQKAGHYLELAAMAGDANARFIIGVEEQTATTPNINRALKHYMIAVKTGHIKSLDAIQKLCSFGLVTKDDYAKALLARQEYLGKIKSVQRDKAASYIDDYKYYELTPEEEECKRHAAELHDEALFKLSPPKEDCPICLVRMPSLHKTGYRYQSCCGKVICSGCIYENSYIDFDKQLCPLCRVPTPALQEEAIERMKRRVDVGDANAICMMGTFYEHGNYGYPQDYKKALELWQEAGELGCADAYHNIALCYEHGRGVEVDKKTAKHYYEVAAMGGNAVARHNLGWMEMETGNYNRASTRLNRALNHWKISAGSGEKSSLLAIKFLLEKGLMTKDEYSEVLRNYQSFMDEIRSDQRDEAAAADDSYKYYESTPEEEECRRRATELQDEALLKQPPPEYEDCPICLSLMPILIEDHVYQSCCGKVICIGCIHAVERMKEDSNLCPHCRTPASTSHKEENERIQKRIEAGDAEAFYNLGTRYGRGTHGYPQDYVKALDHYQRAADLGCAAAYYEIGVAYHNGVDAQLFRQHASPFANGVKVDYNMAKHYFGLAAMKGSVIARYRLGSGWERMNNIDLAIKHYMVAVKSGHKSSLDRVQVLYKERRIPKDVYGQALIAYQEYMKKINE